MSRKLKTHVAKSKAESKAKTLKVPSLRLHKPSNRGFVELEGKRHYLGTWGDAKTQEAYNRIIAQWIENGRRLPSIPKDITVSELMLEYWRYSESYYRRPDGKPTGELNAIRKALQPARELYASVPACEFSPKCLKVVRDTMIGKGWGRNNINKQVGRIKRMFRWGVEEELIGGEVFHALQAVSGLKYGRSAAQESKPVQPVPHAHVDAVIPYLGRQVAAMVQLQRLTGMRPGEVCAMRPCDVDTAGEVWVYRPAHHKTAHHGHERRIYLNATAQAVLRPFLLRDVQAHCFSPIEAEAERRTAQHAERKTPMSCGNKPGSNRKDDPAWTPGTCYDTLAYGHAIARAIAKANKERDADNQIPPWSPHKLRHTFATDVRATLGLESAQVLLGHARADVTQIYAKVNERTAIEAIKAHGRTP